LVTALLFLTTTPLLTIGKYNGLLLYCVHIHVHVCMQVTKLSHLWGVTVMDEDLKVL